MSNEFSDLIDAKYGPDVTTLAQAMFRATGFYDEPDLPETYEEACRIVENLTEDQPQGEVRLRRFKPDERNHSSACTMLFLRGSGPMLFSIQHRPNGDRRVSFTLERKYLAQFPDAWPAMRTFLDVVYKAADTADAA